LPVRERAIPKPGGAGRVRRLGIPVIADRVVQAALKLVLEPIFEADFLPVSYGFRPMRRAHDAIAEIHHFGTHAYRWVLDADIEACLGVSSPSRPKEVDQARTHPVGVSDSLIDPLVNSLIVHTPVVVGQQHRQHFQLPTGHRVDGQPIGFWMDRPDGQRCAIDHAPVMAEPLHQRVHDGRLQPLLGEGGGIRDRPLVVAPVLADALPRLLEAFSGLGSALARGLMPRGMGHDRHPLVAARPARTGA
jgi:hypothetical protein